jgi:hypothetical protein
MCKNNGYAGMLGLLIVLVIGLMIYFIDMKAIFGPGGHTVTHKINPEDHPWDMEDLLVANDQTVSVPHKGQPELLEALNLTASVYRTDTPRGSVSIVFGKDCRLVADWSAHYEYDKKTFHIQTQLKGNAVPSKVYSDINDNEDKTRLFFIGKGPYTQTSQWTDAEPRTEQGTAYMIGWLHPDNTAEGTITITTDQSWSAVYDFKTMTEKSATAK